MQACTSLPDNATALWDDDVGAIIEHYLQTNPVKPTAYVI